MCLVPWNISDDAVIFADTMVDLLVKASPHKKQALQKAFEGNDDLVEYTSKWETEGHITKAIAYSG